MSKATSIPSATDFTSSPRRHRLRVRLKAPVSQVWALVGNHARLPEYSAGISHVAVTGKDDPRGESRTCFFRPMEDGAEGMSVRERVLWYAPELGYATSAEPGNAFGLIGDLSLVTVEPVRDQTVFTWDQHYDMPDDAALDMMRKSFGEGITDIANNLVRKFGGEVLENTVERPR